MDKPKRNFTEQTKLNRFAQAIIKDYDGMVAERDKYYAELLKEHELIGEIRQTQKEAKKCLLIHRT